MFQAWAFRDRVRRPALWAPATISASILGLFLALETVDTVWRWTGVDWAGGATAGVLMGAISAPVLWWMVRRPISKPAVAPGARGEQEPAAGQPRAE
jgi:hypothetical protein